MQQIRGAHHEHAEEAAAAGPTDSGDRDARGDEGCECEERDADVSRLVLDGKKQEPQHEQNPQRTSEQGSHEGARDPFDQRAHERRGKLDERVLRKAIDEAGIPRSGRRIAAQVSWTRDHDVRADPRLRVVALLNLVEPGEFLPVEDERLAGALVLPQHAADAVAELNEATLHRRIVEVDTYRVVVDEWCGRPQ